MDTYQLNFAGLLGLCAVLFVAQRKPTEQAKPSGKVKNVDSAEASQWPFLAVFALVMGSDWLQVSHELTHPALTYSTHLQSANTKNSRAPSSTLSTVKNTASPPTSYPPSSPQAFSRAPSPPT